jgi:hypothetical protein
MNLSALDTTTSFESHELIEAVTDPFPQVPNMDGYSGPDLDHYYWTFAAGGGETGDMCAFDPSSFAHVPGLSYGVQRTWSNKSIMLGHDPCVPIPAGEVYFNSVPILAENVTISLGGGSLTMKGVRIPVGTAKTIGVDLYSDADTGGPWTVKAEDFATLMGGTASLTFAWDRTSGQNGERLHLSITSTAATPYGADIFAIVSTKGGEKHYWFGLVGM